MADFEPPSFSLGLDFDLFDSDPHIPAPIEPNQDLSASNRTSEAAKLLEEDDDGDEFETLTVVDSETEEDEGLIPKLKRLRRGPAVDGGGASVKRKADLDLDLDCAVVVEDDDIEEFSSPEDNRTDEHLSTQHRSVCTTSKFPLSGHGVLTKQSGKRKQNFSDAPESVITSCSNQVFPKLTISPLRKFQLIDSDSDTDDPFITEAANNKTYSASESSLNKRQPNLVQEREKLKDSINTSTRKDLWEDFQPAKSFHIPTPALDEVCEEYFSSMKDKSKSHSNTGKSDQNSHVTSSTIDLDPLPPAHRYFFHNDPRIQGLVRSRLPNFFPLNAANRDSEKLSTSNIDYMGQFNQGESSKPAARTKKAETSSKKNSRKSNTKEMSNTRERSKGPVNSKSDTDKGIPKDAGKRRVQADGQASGSGHWFVGPDRKKVYVSKTGQELTGRAAYLLYKKESGAGSKRAKPKKKASTKKK